MQYTDTCTYMKLIASLLKVESVQYFIPIEFTQICKTITLVLFVICLFLILFYLTIYIIIFFKEKVYRPYSFHCLELLICNRAIKLMNISVIINKEYLFHKLIYENKILFFKNCSFHKLVFKSKT